MKNKDKMVVQFSPLLIPIFDPDWGLAKEFIQTLREDLKMERGIKLPPVHFRDTGKFSKGRYEILIDDEIASINFIDTSLPREENLKIITTEIKNCIFANIEKFS